MCGGGHSGSGKAHSGTIGWKSAWIQGRQDLSVDPPCAYGRRPKAPRSHHRGGILGSSRLVVPLRILRGCAEVPLCTLYVSVWRHFGEPLPGTDDVGGPPPRVPSGEPRRGGDVSTMRTRPSLVDGGVPPETNAKPIRKILFLFANGVCALCVCATTTTTQS